jgi:RND family efflux transporter MFP subunit
MNTITPKVLTFGLVTLIAGIAIGFGVATYSGEVPSEAEGQPATSMEGMAGMDSADGMAAGEGMAGMDSDDGMAGMDMSGDGSIRLTSSDVNTFGITFGVAEVRPLTKTVRAVGIVEFDETRMAFVSPKFGGWAETLYVDFTGQTVERGDALLEIYSPELVTAQEELLLAARMKASVGDSSIESVADGADRLFESARRRLEYWDITPEQIERLLETSEVRKTLTLYAPVSGVVMKKEIVEGQAFQAGANLYMIAELSQVWVSAEVFETDADLVRAGMAVEVTVAALAGRAFAGRVEYVYPTLEERTRSMRARVALANPEGELKPGMFGTVRLTAELGMELTLPSAAVLHSGARAVAFVDMGGGELMPHELQLGLHGEGHIQVLEGIEAGQRVVTSAQFLLDSESNLAEVMKAMMAQMNLSDMEGMDMSGMDMGGMDMGSDDMSGMDMGDGSMSGMNMDGDTISRPDTTGGR